MSGQAGNSGYRDEREAALAQAESLRQRVAVLEPECERLRQENDQLRRELSKYTGFAPRPSSSAGAIIAVIAVAVFAVLFVAGAAAFFMVRSSSVEAPVPSSMPAPPSMPVPVPVPTSTVAPVPVQPSLPSGLNYAPTGT